MVFYAFVNKDSNRGVYRVDLKNHRIKEQDLLLLVKLKRGLSELMFAGDGFLYGHYDVSDVLKIVI